MAHSFYIMELALFLSVAVALIGLIVDSNQNQENRDWQQEMMEEQNEWNDYQPRIDRGLEAGINPNLLIASILGNPSTGTAGGVAGSPALGDLGSIIGNTPNSFSSLLKAFDDNQKTNAELKNLNLDAMQKEWDLQIAPMNAQDQHNYMVALTDKAVKDGQYDDAMSQKILSETEHFNNCTYYEIEQYKNNLAIQDQQLLNMQQEFNKLVGETNLLEGQVLNEYKDLQVKDSQIAQNYANAQYTIGLDQMNEEQKLFVQNRVSAYKAAGVTCFSDDALQNRVIAMLTGDEKAIKDSNTMMNACFDYADKAYSSQLDTAFKNRWKKARTEGAVSFGQSLGAAPGQILGNMFKFKPF